MIRVEALNHAGSFDLLGIFEEDQRERINACIDENDNYFLHVIKTGTRRKLLWKNYNKGEC